MEIKKDNQKHGNNAHIDPDKKVTPVYETYTITSKKQSTVHTKMASPVNDENVHLSKREVDENHK